MQIKPKLNENKWKISGKNNRISKKRAKCRKNRQAKGKLNVNDLIYSYPKFVEAEKKENYKNLKIFDKNFLESQDKLLTEYIKYRF